MRNSAVIILSGIVLLTQALLAHAEGGGPLTAPAASTASPAPPAAGLDVGSPLPQKPALKGNTAMGTSGATVDNQAAGPVATDTSTAAPGGQAESSNNGALSSPPDAASPPDGNPVHPNHDRQQPANKAGEETPK
jgi:hypothetical protein